MFSGAKAGVGVALALLASAEPSEADLARLASAVAGVAGVGLDQVKSLALTSQAAQVSCPLAPFPLPPKPFPLPPKKEDRAREKFGVCECVDSSCTTSVYSQQIKQWHT